MTRWAPAILIPLAWLPWTLTSLMVKSALDQSIRVGNAKVCAASSKENSGA